MKKIIITLCFLLLTITGCSSDKLVSIPQNKITELDNKYDYKTGKCRVDDLLVLYKYKNRDDKLSIIDDDDNYYYFSDGSDILFAIDKKYVRLDSEDKFVPYTGYTKSGSKLYSNIDLNESVKSFSLNDNVQVIDSFAGLLLVEIDGVRGYMYPSGVSKNKISVYVAPKPQETPVDVGGSSSHDKDDDSGSSSGGGGSSSGGGGGSDSGGGDDSGGGGSSDDENPIDFGDLYVPNPYVTLCAYSTAINATVLADGIPCYIAILNRGDVVYVIGEEDDNYIVLFDGGFGSIEKKFIMLDSDAKESSEELYSKSNVVVYSDYKLTKHIKTLKLNSIVKVLDKIDDILIVELEDGTVGYMRESNTSKTKISVYVAPKPQETPVDVGGSSSHDKDDDSGSSSGGGGSSSGGGGGSDSGGGDDSGGGGSDDDGWSEAVL